jgi:hypothetical protein
MTGDQLGGVVSRLREELDRNREYTVVGNDNLFRASFVDRHVFSSEHARARGLLQRLRQGYPGYRRVAEERLQELSR